MTGIVWILGLGSLVAADRAYAADATVTVPLSVYEERMAHNTVAPAVAPGFVLGAARWTGVADPATLALAIDATLQVSLSGTGWKQVPLVGADVVLLSVEVDGQPQPVGRDGGYHTWPTDGVGERTVHLRAIASPSADKGAVEYDFGVPRTAATQLALTLPRPGLRPEVQAAVRSTVDTVGETTRIAADLSPTDRIGLVGLRDLGDAEARPPKLYAETEHLVSVDDRRVELFTVLHYTILYAGARQFEVFVPEGFEVVSADAEGAYAYTLEPGDGGSILHGETAFPIHNKYEVSLRLVRDLPEAATRLQLPYAVGVEREHGWVGLEVPGRVRLEEVEPDGIVAADVHLLPDELRRASVSPLLHGFRTHGDGAVRLRAVPLPEVEVSSERLDRVRATTVVSASGRAVTELTLTLRNRLRPGLALGLPAGAEVTRAFLDGEPVVPSRTPDGAIVLPLRRSAPDAPFTVQVVYAGELGAPGWLGWTTLALPVLDLPASEVSWEVRLPDGWRWSGLRSDVVSQRRIGSGHWLADQARGGNLDGGAVSQLSAPEGGPALAYERYWVPAGDEVRVWAWSMAPVLWVAWRALVALGVLAVTGYVGLRIRPTLARSLAGWKAGARASSS